MGTALEGYDGEGRFEHLVYPNPPSSAFTQTAQATYQYDPAGRVISIQDTRLAAGASSQAGGWGFSWDAVGRLATLRGPANTRRCRLYAAHAAP